MGTASVETACGVHHLFALEEHNELPENAQNNVKVPPLFRRITVTKTR
jgi:hypothetical protein